MCILSRTDVRLADDCNEACKAKMRRQNHSNFYSSLSQIPEVKFQAQDMPESVTIARADYRKVKTLVNVMSCVAAYVRSWITAAYYEHEHEQRQNICLCSAIVTQSYALQTWGNPRPYSEVRPLSILQAPSFLLAIFQRPNGGKEP